MDRGERGSSSSSSSSRSRRAQFVDGRDAAGCTALARACRDGHASLVRCLLEAQADPTIEDPLRRTAVSHAVFCGHHDVLAVLLGSGPGRPWRARAATVLHLADSRSGHTALQLALARGDRTAWAILDSAQRVHAQAARAQAVRSDVASRREHGRQRRRRGR
jgi:ankyrin repeat protein